MEQTEDKKKVKSTHSIIKTFILIIVVGIVVGAGVMLKIIKAAPPLDIIKF